MPLQKIVLCKALKKLHRRKRPKLESPLESPTSTLTFYGKSNSDTDTDTHDPLHPSSESSNVPSDVRVGFFPVYVGEESRRYVIPLQYLNHHVFVALLNRAEEEFGFSNSGIIRLPCETALFEHLLWLLNRDDPSLQNFVGFESIFSFTFFYQLVGSSEGGAIEYLTKSRNGVS